MAAIWVHKSHLFQYKLIGLSDLGDLSFVSYVLDYDKANGGLTMSLKVKNSGHFP